MPWVVSTNISTNISHHTILTFWTNVTTKMAETSETNFVWDKDAQQLQKKLPVW